MAKAVITTRNDDSFTIVSDDEFFVNYDEAKHGEIVSKASNTRRRGAFEGSIDAAIRGTRRVVAVDVENTEDQKANVEVLSHVLTATGANGETVIINGQDIVSVVISD